MRPLALESSGWTTRLLLSLKVMAVLVAGALICGCQPPRPTIEGEVKRRHQNDTLTVEYDLVIDEKYYHIDTLYLEIFRPNTVSPTDEVIFIRADSGSDISLHRHVDFKNGRGRLSGELQYPLPDSLTVNKCSIHGDMGVPLKHNLSFVTPTGNGLFLALGNAFVDRSVYPANVRETEDNLLLHAGFGAIFFRRAYTASISSAFNIAGEDKESHRNALSQYAKIGIRLHPYGRHRLLPSPLLVVSFDRMKVQLNASDRHRIQGFGLTLGAMIETKWERLNYTYNTGLGGYHCVDFLNCFTTGQTSRFGTMYSVYRGDDVRMFLMRFYFEVLDVGDELMLSDRRSVFRKTLSYGPLAPIYLLGQILTWVGNEDR